MEMKTEIVTMTPSCAKKLLLNNVSNRRVKENNVNYFCKLINNGEWMVTHQGIAVAKDGTLLDGQHRLLAIARSGKPVKIMITTGMDLEIFKSIDNGVTRNSADLTGIKKSTVDVIKFCLTITYGKFKPTPGDILKFYDTKLGKICDRVSKTKNVRVLSNAPTRAAAAILSLKHGEKVEIEFANLISSNFDLMTNVQKALIKKLATTGDISNESYRDYRLRNSRFSNMHFALNPINSDRKIIKADSRYTDECLNDLKQITKFFMES